MTIYGFQSYIQKYDVEKSEEGWEEIHCAGEPWGEMGNCGSMQISGEEILLMGGTAQEGPISTCYIFHVPTGAVRSVACLLREEKFNASKGVLVEGEVMIFGDFYGDIVLHKYTLASNTWNMVPQETWLEGS